MKRKILPGIILALALGSVGVWALITNTGSFPKFNRYYHLDDYLDDLETALSRSIPFSDNLSSLAIDLKMKGGAREFDNIFIGDDILVEDIGYPDEAKTEQNIQALTRFSENSRIPTYVMLIPTKCAIKQNEVPQAAPLFNQKQFIEQSYNRLLGKATVVDVYPTLFSKLDQDLYYKTAPDLTALGGYYVYEVLAQRLDNTPKPQEDFDIQYITHSYYGKTYQKSAYKDISPDIIALYRYQKNNRNYTVTHNEEYQYTYNTLYPEQMMEVGEDDLSVLLGEDTGDITIRSNLKNENTLLIVGDDSILPVIPFLAAHYSQIRFIDLEQMSAEEIEKIDCSDYQRMLISYSVDTFIHQDVVQKVVYLNTQDQEEMKTIQQAVQP